MKIIVVSVVIVMAVALAALSVPGLRQILPGLGSSFSGNDVLLSAERALSDANEKLKSNPNDEASHLARARAYLLFGYYEGARLEWEANKNGTDPGWGEVGRSLEELERKTEEIRNLLIEAETSASPAQKYPPIYALLDDVAAGFDGVPKYRALFLKGYLLLREGRKAEAELVFAGEVRDYSPLKEYVAYNHARTLMTEGSEDQALSELNDFINDHPSSRLAPLAHLERINLLRDLGRSEEAVRECNRAIDRYPTCAFAPKTLRKLAELYEDAMDFENGSRVRVRIIREFPDSEEARESKSMFFGGVYSLDLLSEADRVEVAFSAVSSNTSDVLPVLSSLADSGSLETSLRARACLGAGMCEARLDRLYEAIDWFNKAMDLAPGTEWSDRAGIRAGDAFSSLNKNDLAIGAYWKVVRGGGPKASAAGEVLWEFAYELTDLPTVEQACRYVVEEYPRSAETPRALTMLASLACRDGRYQTGISYSENCVRNFPDDPASAEAGFWHARALQGTGKNVEADQAWSELTAKVPWSYWGIRAAEVSGNPSGPDKSVDPFSFDPEGMGEGDGAVAIGWELYDTGVLDLAESEFRLAIQQGEKGAQTGLALVLAEENDIQSAVLVFREASLKGDQAWLTPARQDRVLSELFPRPFENQVKTAALAHDVQPSWLWGTMRQESCFNPRAHSGAGACGLIQIMPETGRFIAAQRGASSFDPSVLWDPATNLDYGAWYLSYLRSRVGSDILDILAAYNGGPGRVERWRTELPVGDDDIFINSIPREETRNFAHWVYTNIRIYDRILRTSGFELVPF
jgi:TolA-binding protein